MKLITFSKLKNILKLKTNISIIPKIITSKLFIYSLIIKQLY